MKHLVRPAAVSVFVSLLLYGLATGGLLFYALGTEKGFSIPGVYTVTVTRDGTFSAAFHGGYPIGLVVLFVLLTVLLAMMWRKGPDSKPTSSPRS